METLNSPVYEVKQDSQWYKDKIETKKKRKELFNELKNYFDDNGFAYYHESHFGVYGTSEDYEVYKDELKKNPDKNGIYIFKKRSKYFEIFNTMLKSVEEKEHPFKAMDVLGLNNVRQSQWLGDRWFWSVKKEDLVVGAEVELINYKDYLKVVMESVDE